MLEAHALSGGPHCADETDLHGPSPLCSFFFSLFFFLEELSLRTGKMRTDHIHVAGFSRKREKKRKKKKAWKRMVCLIFGEACRKSSRIPEKKEKKKVLCNSAAAVWLVLVTYLQSVRPSLTSQYR